MSSSRVVDGHSPVGAKRVPSSALHGQPSNQRHTESLPTNGIDIKEEAPDSGTNASNEEEEGSVNKAVKVADTAPEENVDLDTVDDNDQPRPTTSIKRLPSTCHPLQALPPRDSSIAEPENSASVLTSHHFTPHPQVSGKRLPGPYGETYSHSLTSASHGFPNPLFMDRPGTLSLSSSEDYISPCTAIVPQAVEYSQRPAKKRAKTKPMSKIEQLSKIASLGAQLEAFNKAADERAIQQGVAAKSHLPSSVMTPLPQDSTHPQPDPTPIASSSARPSHSTPEPSTKRKRSRDISPPATSPTPSKPPREHSKRASGNRSAELKEKKMMMMMKKKKKKKKNPRNPLFDIPEKAQAIAEALHELGGPFEDGIDEMTSHSEEIMVVDSGNTGGVVVGDELGAMVRAWKQSNRAHLERVTTLLMRNGVVGMGAVTVPDGSLDIVRSADVAGADTVCGLEGEAR